jgi:hypothetical protein
MFVVTVKSMKHKDRLYFVRQDLSDVCLIFDGAAKFPTRREAQGAALLLAARKPNYIGQIKVMQYAGTIRIADDE